MDLPNEAGATHTGTFVACGLASGLAGAIYLEDFPDTIQRLKAPSVTPGQFFLEGGRGVAANNFGWHILWGACE